MAVSQRIANLRQCLAQEGLDTMVISDGVNRRYLSGFTGSAGWLILSQTRALFATDSRYYEQVGQQSPDFQLERVSYDFIGNLERMLKEVGGRRVGFEAKTVTVADFEAWKKATPEVEWVGTQGMVEKLRAIKEPDEIATLQEAVRLTDEAFACIVAYIRPGMTETQVSWEIEKFFRAHGAVAWPHGIIVASGPNAALPHARPTDRVIQRGEPIVMDFGCIYQGYFSDMTRTIILGRADSQFEQVYATVLNAHQTAEDGARAGLPGKDIDAMARGVIQAAGYGDYFGHGLGHGVGLAIHEAPRAGQNAEEPVAAGMTLTIEPGVYIPNWGGVRVEDMIVIGPEGSQVLTQSPKRLYDMVVPV